MLKQVTSNVLNRPVQPSTKAVESEPEKTPKDETTKPATEAEPPIKETGIENTTVPAIQISEGTNITINFN